MFLGFCVESRNVRQCANRFTFRCSRLAVNSKPRKLNLPCKRSGSEMKVGSGGETSHVLHCTAMS